MSDSFQNWLEQSQLRINNTLAGILGTRDSNYCPNADQYLGSIEEASYYSLLNGGKRVRAALCFAAAEAISFKIASKNGDSLSQVAAAIELIHAYSLVHDDLPAMDDDNLRRGKPTNHIVYNEAMAILVGDGLQTRAFEVLANCSELAADRRIELIQHLSAASGIRGMVGGQAIDIAATNQTIDIEHLRSMHRLKTGALIRASVAMGAITAGASTEQLKALDEFALNIGLAFQVQDDILDEASDSATLGKNQGSDKDADKPTYTSLLGLEPARQEASALLGLAKSALEPFAERALRLNQLADFIVNRRS